MTATLRQQNTLSNDDKAQQAQANRIRNLRIASGLSQVASARQAHVNVTTWRAWELGTHAPRLHRAPQIAQALGIPVCALSAPDGWAAITDVQLTPEAVDRVRRGGEPEARRIADQVASQLAPMILATCRTQQRPSNTSRGKPRRSRAEVLAGIAQANEMRLQAQARRLTGAGPSEGATRDTQGGLPGAQADSLTAEP